MKKVTYLGHTFSANEMAPDETKVKAVMDWPTPCNVGAVHQFLGLASYYRSISGDLQTSQHHCMTLPKREHHSCGLKLVM